jgi:hypothetical protein
MTSVMTSRRLGGMYVVTPHVDQMARLLGTRIEQPCAMTAGEWSAFRRTNIAVERWVERLDTRGNH